MLVLLACGAFELALRRMRREPETGAGALIPLFPVAVASGGMGALAWTSFKVGALSFGGGFVIIPLCRATPSTSTTG